MDLPTWTPNKAGLTSEAATIIRQRQPVIDRFKAANPQWKTRIDKVAAWHVALDIGVADHYVSEAATRLYKDLRIGTASDNPQGWKLWSLSRVRTLFLDLAESSPFRTRRMKWLSAQNCCPDETTKQVMLATIEQLEQEVVGTLKGILIDYQRYSWFGLLKSSSYACYPELVFIERWRSTIAERLSEDAQPLIAQVRMDTWALFQTLSPLTRLKFPQHKRRKNVVSLWQQHMLHAPARSPERLLYADWFDSELTSTVVATLGQHRCSTAEQAANLWQLFLEGGLVSIIDARLAGEIPKFASIRQDRYAKAITYHMQGMRVNAQKEVRERFADLVACAERHTIIIPFLAMIETLPGDRRRVKAGRRLWFGASAILKRRQSARRVSRNLQRRPPKPKKPDTSLQDRFVADLASVWDIDLPATRQRVRDFISYGLLGLLPFGHRDSVLDEDLYDYLRFLKWGYIEGVIDKDVVHDRINRWAKLLDQPTLARTLCDALWSHVHKETRWNGGNGPPVQYVRQRKTLVVPAPRLNEHWFCIPWSWPVPLLDEDYHPLSAVTYAVVVLEEACPIPMGIGFSSKPLTPADYGLATYTAIWHPGYPQYPVRGIPEVLHLPADEPAESWKDIFRAMEWVDTEVKTSSTQHLQAYLASVMEATVAGLLSGRQGIRAKTAVALTLQIWDELYFAQHQPVPLPPGLRDRGVANYGLATPLAGWLLPVCGHVEARQGGFIDQGRFYSLPQVDATTRQWNKRIFPFRSSKNLQQSFIENGTTIIPIDEEEL